MSTFSAIPPIDQVCAPPSDRQRCLLGRAADVLMLWGSSLLLLPILALLPAETYAGPVAAITLGLAHFINHPHFANSYQLFYRHYSAKLFGTNYSPELRMRYAWAGIGVPLLLIALFLVIPSSFGIESLGIFANLMLLLVGWHYAKQGYGILMLDAVLKGFRFTGREKNTVLVNGHVVWLVTWMQANVALHEHQFWGVTYLTVGIPQAALQVGYALATVGALITGWTLWGATKRQGVSIPFNGFMAYVVSLYVWLLFVRIHPLWLLLVPALHSLQYLAVVWRYQLNYESRAVPEEEKRSWWARNWHGPENRRARLAWFAALGVVLGYLGFWWVPELLQQNVSFITPTQGAVFFFACWIFINVHHYFLDSVMWRRDNPDMRRFLAG